MILCMIVFIIPLQNIINSIQSPVLHEKLLEIRSSLNWYKLKMLQSLQTKRMLNFKKMILVQRNTSDKSMQKKLHTSPASQMMMMMITMTRMMMVVTQLPAGRKMVVLMRKEFWCFMTSSSSPPGRLPFQTLIALQPLMLLMCGAPQCAAHRTAVGQFIVSQWQQCHSDLVSQTDVSFAL